MEDEKELAKELKNLLNKEGFYATVEYNGDKALDTALSESFDIIILDIMLPGLNGYEILKHIRNEKIATPVLILTAKADITDKVKGLDLGADDYVVKPFSSFELLARIRAVLRRFSGENTNIITARNISLNLATKEIFINKKKLDLTPKEYSILEFLILNKNKPVSKYNIAEHVWGDTYDIISTSNFVEVHVKNIRKKISKLTDNQVIETERGFGYKISECSEQTFLIRKPNDNKS